MDRIRGGKDRLNMVVLRVEEGHWIQRGKAGRGRGRRGERARHDFQPGKFHAGRKAKSWKELVRRVKGQRENVRCKGGGGSIIFILLNSAKVIPTREEGINQKKKIGFEVRKTLSGKIDGLKARSLQAVSSSQARVDIKGRGGRRKGRISFLLRSAKRKKRKKKKSDFAGGGVRRERKKKKQPKRRFSIWR